jgi:hypothetical protein
MLILSAMLVAAAVWALRKKAGSKTMLSIALAALVSFEGAGGTHTFTSAFANGYPSFYMESANGGEVPITSGFGLAYVRNNTPVPLKIISVTPVEAQNADAPACAPGVIVAPSAFCYVNLGTTPG